MKHSFIIGFLILLSCSGKKDRIVVPELERDFYAQALETLDDKLDRDDQDLQLIEQKLYYCERLNWPETCLEALDEYKRQKGMTPQLLDQYIVYYLNQESYASLLDIIERWSTVFDKEKDFVNKSR